MASFPRSRAIVCACELSITWAAVCGCSCRGQLCALYAAEAVVLMRTFAAEERKRNRAACTVEEVCVTSVEAPVCSQPATSLASSRKGKENKLRAWEALLADNVTGTIGVGVHVLGDSSSRRLARAVRSE